MIIYIYLVLRGLPGFSIGWVVACQLRKRLNTSKEKRQARRKADLKKAGTNGHVCGKRLLGGSMTCWFTQAVR